MVALWFFIFFFVRVWLFFSWPSWEAEAWKYIIWIQLHPQFCGVTVVIAAFFPSYAGVPISQSCIKFVSNLTFSYSTEKNGKDVETLWLMQGGKCSFVSILIVLLNSFFSLAVDYTAIFIYLFIFFHEADCHPVIAVGKWSSFNSLCCFLSFWKCSWGAYLWRKGVPVD